MCQLVNCHKARAIMAKIAYNISMKNKSTARPTAAQIQKAQAKADRRAAALERQQPEIAAYNARVNAMYTTIA